MQWEKVSIDRVIHEPISGEWGEEGESVKVLRTTNFTNTGRLKLDNVVSRDIDPKKIERKKLQYGDTIIEKSGGGPGQPVGRVVYFDIEGETLLCNNFTAIIRAKLEIFPKFLFWFLFANHVNKNTLHYQNKTTGILNLQLARYLNELQIPLPPLPIQHAIADRLDRADALRQKDRQLLQAYDELAQAVFVEMFGDPVRNEKGWEIRKVNSIVKDITAGSSFGGEERTLSENDLGVLKVSAVTRGYFKSDEFKSIPKSLIEKKQLVHPRKGDLLFSRANTRELVAATCIVDDDYPHLFLPDKLWRIDLKKSLCEPTYFKFLLSDKKFKTTLTKTATGTSGSMLNVSMEKLKSLLVPLPPLILQTKFATILANIEQQKELVRQQQAESEALFGRLLQEAFGN